MKFTDFGLNGALQTAVAEMGYERATPVQQEAIPVLLQGKDILASADTGTGKTAAFLLPGLQKLLTPSEVKSKGPRILVLSPTRELASQIWDASKKLGKNIEKFRSVRVLGGMPYQVQRRDLKHYVDVLVATPGRLLDLYKDEDIDFSRVELFVLDEADRMFDMGFIDDVQEIAEALPQDRQTVLFSATLKDNILKLAKKITRDPVRIEIKREEITHKNIEQKAIIFESRKQKFKHLLEILQGNDVAQAIVFAGTKEDTRVLAEDLNEEGISAIALHGDLRQQQRLRAVAKVRAQEFQILVATDVAARGIDIRGISHVINYELPRSADDYTHRIGRTGRASDTGVAMTFITERETSRFKQLVKALGHPIILQNSEGKTVSLSDQRSTERSSEKKPGRDSRRRDRGGRNSNARSSEGRRDRGRGQESKKFKFEGKKKSTGSDRREDRRISPSAPREDRGDQRYFSKESPKKHFGKNNQKTFNKKSDSSEKTQKDFFQKRDRKTQSKGKFAKPNKFIHRKR